MASMKSQPLVNKFCLSIALMAFSTTLLAAKYQLVMNWNDSECIQFLNAVKASRIEYMTNEQLCESITLPVTQVLPGSLFKELAWHPITNIDVNEVAKSVWGASLPIRRRQKSEEIDMAWLQEVNKLNAAGQVVVEESHVQLTHRDFFVVQLREKVCDAAYNEHGPLPLYGFFEDQAHVHGVPIHPLPMGQLIYFRGHLAAFDLDPEWILDNVKKREKLAVTLEYLNDSTGGMVTSIAKTCPVLISK